MNEPVKHADSICAHLQELSFAALGEPRTRDGQMNRRIRAMLIATMVVFGAVFLHAREPRGVVADGNKTTYTTLMDARE